MKYKTHIAIVSTALVKLTITTGVFAENMQDSLTEQKSCFYSAKQEITGMLSGKEPLSYERAIFVMENAYRNNVISYNRFQSAIVENIELIKQLADINRNESAQDFKATLFESQDVKREKYNKALNNYAIFTYITDTTFSFVTDKTSGKNGIVYHLPFQYSAEDPLASDDWKNSQVLSLLDRSKRKGNCFALASLFKIFSERLNSEANICTAPGHIYMRHADTKGICYNVELASRVFPGTGSIEVLTYTTDEATINGISLRELNLKQSVGLCLINLAKGFEHKFKTKDDNFILQCAELALQYDSLNLNAMLLKAEFLEHKIVAKNKTVAQLQVDKQFKEYEKLITHLYKLGYREMPLEMKNIIVHALRKDSVPIITKDHTPQPFKDLGIKDKRYATVSRGLFDEMHEEKPYEQYTQTVFDTKRKKISKFVKTDMLYNKYNFDPVVFAWNVDPLASKYPSMSPYSAFNNNPVYYVDPDGRSGVAYITNNINEATGRPIIKVVSNIYLYGEGTKDANLKNIQAGISGQYNNNGNYFTTTVEGVQYDIQFEFNVTTIDSKDVDEMFNKGGGVDNAENNFYEVNENIFGSKEGNAGITLTGKFSPGGNTGAIETSSINDNTTLSHELNHGYGGENKDRKDNIILPENDIAIQSQNSANPAGRKVTQGNIDAIFKNVKFENGKGNVGNPRPQLHDKEKGHRDAKKF